MKYRLKFKLKSRIGALRMMTARILIIAVFLTLFSFPGLLPDHFTEILPGLFPGEMTAYAASGSQSAGGGGKPGSGSQMGNDGKDDGKNDATDDGKNDGTDDGKNDEEDNRTDGEDEIDSEAPEKEEEEPEGEEVQPVQARLLGATASDAWIDYRDAEWSGGEIRTAGELAQFAYLIGEGDDFAGETVSLAEDINLKQHRWKAIRGMFSGTFDGKGHTITGMNVEAESNSMAAGGFFFMVTEAEIKNLDLSGNIRLRPGEDAAFVIAGGIAAIVSNSEVRNCSTDIAIRETEGQEEPNMVQLGTMFGMASNSRFENCTAGGSLTLNHIKGNKKGCILDVGGLTGYAESCDFAECTNTADVNCALEYDENGRNPELCAAGVAGNASECNFTDCTNEADVRCVMEYNENDQDAWIYVGGIAGIAESGSFFNRCSNQGDLSVEGYCVESGGIASLINDSTVINCVNTGSVRAEGKGEAATGGICGAAYLWSSMEPIGRIANCANYGSLSSRSDGGMVWSGGIGGSVGGFEDEQIVITIENCISAGRVSAEGTGSGALSYRGVGGICGYGGTCEIRHCFWLGGTAKEPVTLDEDNLREKNAEVFDSAIYDRKNGSCLLREEVSGTYSLMKALNLWAGEHFGEDGFNFDGWRMKDGKPSPAAGLDPNEALESEQAVGRSSGGRGKSGFSPKWTQDEKGWRYQTSPVEFTTGGWANLYWDGAYYWYHFNAEGYLDTGWFTDADGAVYYLHPLHDGKYGYMYTGLNSIEGKEYYFETESGMGQGALYRNRTTLDGYAADENGILSR